MAWAFATISRGTAAARAIAASQILEARRAGSTSFDAGGGGSSRPERGRRRFEEL